MVNYQQGKIYKIVCNTTGLVYIGSTCEKRLSTRLSHHVAHYKKNLTEKYSYASSFEIIKNGNYEIFLIENYPCGNSDELRMRERFYKESQECVNVNNPIRLTEDEILSHKKYYEENKEAIKLSYKRYYEENREKEKIRNQKFRIENRENEKLRFQKYYDENKETINFKQREKKRLKKLYLEQLKYYNL